MDRHTFAACAVFALPLSILGVGCDSKPARPSRAERSAPPAVLAELDKLPATARHRRSESRVAMATQLIDEDTVLPNSGAHGSGPSARPTELRPVPTTLPVEPLDAPPAPEPETLVAPRTPVAAEPPVSAEVPRSTIDVPMGDVDARIVFPSGSIDMAAPQATDGSALPGPAAPPVATHTAPAIEHAVEPRVEQPVAQREPQTAQAPVASPPVMSFAPVSSLPAKSTPATSAPPAAARAQMPWANAPPRGAEMNAVSERAHGLVRHGFRLAERGALFSARAEFVSALQVIAQANDTEQNTRLYTKALTAGLVALQESSDFVRPTRGLSQNDVEKLVTSHKTPVLKRAPIDGVNPLQAAQRYYSYAQEQLAAAAAQEPAGSMALFGLAKVAVSSAGNNKSLQFERAAQAMTLYQAALIAEPKNFLAANELGVLLADNGNLSRARDWLVHSVSLSQQASTWQNLAAVHARLGERELSEHAMAQAKVLREAGQVAGTPAVQYVDPETFANAAPVSDAVMPAVTSVKATPAPTKTSAAAPAAAPAPETARKGISDWLPWNARR